MTVRCHTVPPTQQTMSSDLPLNDRSAEPEKGPTLVALERGAAEAAAGDAEAAVCTVVESGYPDRLVTGTLATRYSRVPRDVRAEAVAEGVAALHQAVVARRPVPRPGGYVLKVADAICAGEQRRQEAQASADGLTDHELLGATAPWADTEDAEVRARRRTAAVRLARTLLPRLGQERGQQAMGYVLDAVERGEVHVPSQDVADALGLSDDVVRQSLSRGFRRLARLAAEQNLDVQAVDLLDDPDFQPDDLIGDPK